MAKVTGPLFSMSASGKLGDAMVFFPWKGLNVVRQWVIPANKMSASQGNQRVTLGGTGRAVGMINAFVGVTTVIPAFAQQLITLNLIPAGQTKQSFLVKYIVDHYLSTVALFTAELAAYSAHTSKAAFEASATTLGLVNFSLSYATQGTYAKGLGLYLIAKASSALGFAGTPYITNINAWITTDVAGMVTDFTSV